MLANLNRTSKGDNMSNFEVCIGVNGARTALADVVSTHTTIDGANRAADVYRASGDAPKGTFIFIRAN